MAGRSPAGPLMHEHRVIERMLKVLSRQLESMFELQAVDTAAVDTAVDFIRTYADRCHHGKEEAQFFPLARQRGVTCAPGNIDILLAEHEQGRSHVRAMAESLTAAEKGDS